jgi:hypothetical protein
MAPVFEEDATNETNAGGARRFEVTICDFKFERRPKPETTLDQLGAIMIAIHRKDS